MTDATQCEKRTVPRGATRIGIDTNGNTHWFAGAVKDRRVFIADGEEILETHDLRELVTEGVLDVDTPRAWADEFEAHAVGFETLQLGNSLVDQLAQALEMEMEAAR